MPGPVQVDYHLAQLRMRLACNELAALTGISYQHLVMGDHILLLHGTHILDLGEC